MKNVSTNVLLRMLLLFPSVLVSWARYSIPSWDTSSQAARLVLPASAGSYAWSTCGSGTSTTPCITSSALSVPDLYWTTTYIGSTCTGCSLIRSALRGTCVQASAASNGASLTMGTCSASNPLQQWEIWLYNCVPSGLTPTECDSNNFFKLHNTNLVIQRASPSSSTLILTTYAATNLKLHTVIVSPPVSYVNDGSYCLSDSNCHSAICTFSSCCSSNVAMCSSCRGGTGQCESCFGLYVLNNGKCELKPPPSGGSGGDPAAKEAVDQAERICGEREGACWGLMGFGMFLLFTAAVKLVKMFAEANGKFNPCIPKEGVEYLCGCGGSGLACILIGSGIAAGGLDAGYSAVFIIAGVIAGIGPAITRCYRGSKSPKDGTQPPVVVEFAEINPVPRAIDRKARVEIMNDSEKSAGASV